MSVMVGTWRRYSWRAVSRPAKPRCQPSIIASENAHTQEVAHVVSVSGAPRQPLREARPPQHRGDTDQDRRTGVPHPTWAFHHPKIGASSRKIAEAFGGGVDQRRDDAQV